jgi:hypothetical protein
MSYSGWKIWNQKVLKIFILKTIISPEDPRREKGFGNKLPKCKKMFDFFCLL